MGQKRVIINVTEAEAKAIAWALERAGMVSWTESAARSAGRLVEWRKLRSATEVVRAATDHLPVFETWHKKNPTLRTNAGSLRRYR